MSGMRFGAPTLSVEQALLILIKKYRKDKPALNELKTFYSLGAKTMADKVKLANWMQDEAIVAAKEAINDIAHKNSPRERKFLKYGLSLFQSSNKASPKSSPKGSPKDSASGPKPGWNIAPITMAEYFEGLKKGQHLLPNDAEFTSLRHAVRDAHEIAEIAAATGEPVLNKLITYPIHRLALFETVAVIETEMRINSDDDLLQIVQDIYRQSVRPVIRNAKSLQQTIQTTARKMSREALDNADAPYHAVAKSINESIFERYEAGTYTLPTYLHSICDADSDEEINDDNEKLQEIACWAISDRIYSELMLKEVNQLVEPVILNILDDKTNSFSRLSTHLGTNRHTFMISGAPACGKGTIAALVNRYAEDELNIQWDDIVKINTDVHRNIVSHDKITGQERENSVRLNNDEAVFISLRAYGRVLAKVEQGQAAPHFFVDGAEPAIDRLHLGACQDGSTHVMVVTASVPTSIERAYERALETGRYVMTPYMLNAHQSVSGQLFQRLAQFRGKRIEFAIFNNDVPSDSPPRMLMSGDMRTGEAYIYDKQGMAEFYGKRHINTAAKNEDQLFKTNNEVDFSFKEAITAAGMSCNESETPRHAMAVGYKRS